MPTHPNVPPPAAPPAMGRAGQLFEIKSRNRSAVITEQGAGLFSVNWDGTELLNSVNSDGFGGNGAHGQVLAPWPGRISEGRYEYGGSTYELALDDRTHKAAIHGLARWLAWAPRHQEASSITMGTRLLAHPGYPFCLDLEQSYSWRSERLEISFSATNLGQQPAPFGYGCHPYFTLGLPNIDAGVLSVPATEYLGTDEHLNPLLPARLVEGTPYDFRRPRAIGDAKLDLTLTGLERGPDGHVSVVFASPDGAVAITSTYGQAVNFVQIFSGDTLSAGRRRGLAIEPYTAAPNAFNNGLGLHHLAPGETLTVEWSISAQLG